MMVEKTRFVFPGSGGQGVITAANVLAETAVLYENLNAVQTQVYGAAARGGQPVLMSLSPTHRSTFPMWSNPMC